MHHSPPRTNPQRARAHPRRARARQPRQHTHPSAPPCEVCIRCATRQLNESDDSTQEQQLRLHAVVPSETRYKQGSKDALPIVKTVNRIKSPFIYFLFFSLKMFPFLLHSHASQPAITVALSEVGLTSSSLKPALREHRVAAMLQRPDATCLPHRQRQALSCYKQCKHTDSPGLPEYLHAWIERQKYKPEGR